MSKQGRRVRALYSEDDDEEENGSQNENTPQMTLLLQDIGQLKDETKLIKESNEQLIRLVKELFVQLELKNSIEERKQELEDLMSKNFYKLFATAKFVDALSPKSLISPRLLLLEFKKVIPNEIADTTVAEMATEKWVLNFVQETFARFRSEFTFGISKAIGAIYGVKFLKKKRVTLWTDSWTDDFMSRDQLKEILRKTPLRDIAKNILSRMFEDPKVAFKFWPDIEPTCSDLAFVYLKTRWFIEGHSRQLGEDDMVETLSKWNAAATERFKPQLPQATSPSSSSSHSSSPSPSVRLRPSPSPLRSSASPSPAGSAWWDRFGELSSEWHQLSNAPFSIPAYEALKHEFSTLLEQVPHTPATTGLRLDIEERIKLVNSRLETQKQDAFPAPVGGKRRALPDDGAGENAEVKPVAKAKKTTKKAKPAAPTRAQPKG